MSTRDHPAGWPIYRVIRFRESGARRTVKAHLTEAEAQAHCNRDDTKGPGWFDGYDYMRGWKKKIEAGAK